MQQGINGNLASRTTAEDEGRGRMTEIKRASMLWMSGKRSRHWSVPELDSSFFFLLGEVLLLIVAAGIANAAKP